MIVFNGLDGLDGLDGLKKVVKSVAKPVAAVAKPVAKVAVKTSTMAVKSSVNLAKNSLSPQNLNTALKTAGAFVVGGVPAAAATLAQDKNFQKKVLQEAKKAPQALVKTTKDLKSSVTSPKSTTAVQTSSGLVVETKPAEVSQETAQKNMTEGLKIAGAAIPIILALFRI